MSCECQNCKRDNILNGTLKANCFECSIELNSKVSFQIIFDENKSLVCDKCVAERYCSCNSCQKLVKLTLMRSAMVTNEQGVNVETKVCQKCFATNYKECSDCHGFFDRHITMSFNEKPFCKPCFRKYYKTCAHCNSTFPTSQAMRSIRGLITVCDGCYNYYGPIESYEKKPVIEFKGIPPHYYGVELETELVNQKKDERGLKAKEVVDLLGEDFMIVKEDGSLRCGFEICTQPASIDEHKIRWDKFFNKLPDNLHSFNSSNCGLHVHCSKKPLSLLTIAKIVVFVNDDKNKAFVETMAGRKSCTYSCIDKKEYETVKRIGTGRLSRSDRYEAVNLVNADTIEFRIFKGTLKRASFFKALEFCDALIHFCMTATNGISYCRNKENFISYVSSKQKDYPHLYAFICAKVLKEENKLTKQYGFNIETPAANNSPGVPTVTIDGNSNPISPLVNE